MTPELIAEADMYAHERQQNAIEERRRPGNNLIPDWQNDIAIQRLGCRTELASKQPFDPIKWYSFKKGRLDALPDLGDFIKIDVKGIENDSHSLIVKKGGVKPHWAYLLTSAAYHPHYRLIGWMWGEDLLKVPLTCPQPDRPAHVVRQGDPRLLDVRELVAIARRRRSSPDHAKI